MRVGLDLLTSGFNGMDAHIRKGMPSSFGSDVSWEYHERFAAQRVIKGRLSSTRHYVAMARERRVCRRVLLTNGNEIAEESCMSCRRSVEYAEAV